MDYKENKGFRLLTINEKLKKGEYLKKIELANFFGVTTKTIQRDIDDIRSYLAESHVSELKYDKSKKAYHIVNLEREWLSKEAVVGLCKILLESRAFCKEELNDIIEKLLSQVLPVYRKKVEALIRNEQHHYVPLRHEKHLLSIIWELSNFIIDKEVIKFMYMRQDGKTKEREVKPVSIMFSEYYFYLIAYMADESKTFPTIFRIDRIRNLNGTREHYDIPYKEKFDDGEFRKRIQFMYSGELRRVKFEFSGSSIESVLDRLPTAEIIEEKDGAYVLKAEVYGNGIDMWLRSQGDSVKVL